MVEIEGWFWELYWNWRWITVPLGLLAAGNWVWRLRRAIPIGKMYIWTSPNPDFVGIPDTAACRRIYRHRPTRSVIPAMSEPGFIFVAQPSRVDRIQKYEVDDLLGMNTHAVSSPPELWVGRTENSLLPIVGDKWIVCTRWSDDATSLSWRTWLNWRGGAEL